MRIANLSSLILIALLASGWLGASDARAADAPSPKLALSFRPSQPNVDYEIPTEAEYEKCVVKVERTGKTSGWIVLGPGGQMLRRFIDSNADNVVDQWRYYNHGLEVYRDIDSNFNNKPDQCRWLNTAGTRWGIDKNEDRTIDEWKVLSAEEASREAVQALATRNEKGLQAILVSEEDLKTLGIEAELAKKLRASIDAPGKKLQALLAGSKTITAETKWTRFDSASPGTIPADDGKAKQDLYVYENAMAIVETGGETVLLQLGEMVRVGDVWKLTQVPAPIEGETVHVTGGILMQPDTPEAAPVAAETGGLSPEMQTLLEDLQKLDSNSPSPTEGAKALATYNSQRADLLAKLTKVSKTDEERTQWTRQMVDGIAAAVQTGSYDEGLKRLKDLEEETRKIDAKSPNLPYVTYRRLLAEYSIELQTASAEKRQEVQEWWLKQLEAFVKDHPTAEDAGDATLQLAIAREFAGDMEGARKWYDSLVKDYASTDASARGAGAIRRIDLEGKPLGLSGAGLKGGTITSARYEGKVLLVLFWSTWCKPCTEDLPQIRALYEQHHDRGFEIVGVNLDSDVNLIAPYLDEYQVKWPQIYQPGGLESEPAQAFGIISLPTMFLVDKQGKVVNRSVTVADLKELVPELLKK